MTRSRFHQTTGLLMFWLFLAAFQIGCSGGGDDTLAGGGIGGTGVATASVGTVTGFGSVIVNGVSYDTTAAEVFVGNISMGSGDPAVIRNLSAGMVVRVEGMLSEDGSASADRVFFSRNLKGAVESISALDSFSKQAVILGQTVLMDDRTVFRNASPAAIAVGMVLEVSGFSDDSGRIFATYVNKIADSLSADEPVEIIGLVQDLIPPLKTFQIGRLSVDYAASDLSGLPGNAPETGQLLKVTGRLERMNLLVAGRLQLEEEFGSGVFEVVDLEGIITQAGVPGEFGIGRATVKVDRETSFKNLIQQDLNRGTRVIVRGALTGRAILADEIILPEKVRMESNARFIDLIERSLVLSGLESTAVFTTATTRFIGIASGLENVNSGDHVRVSGRRTVGGDVVASKIVVTPSNDAAELAGPLATVAEPFIVILGIEVNTSAIPSDRFTDVNGKAVSPGEFFGIVRPGDNVAVEGVLQAGSVIWTGITFD